MDDSLLANEAGTAPNGNANGAGTPNGARTPRESMMLAMQSSEKKHVHHHVLSDREEEIMNNFEALDYDVIENK